MTIQFGQSVLHLPLLAPVLILVLFVALVAVGLAHRSGDDWIDERWGRGTVSDRWGDGEA